MTRSPNPAQSMYVLISAFFGVLYVLVGTGLAVGWLRIQGI